MKIFFRLILLLFIFVFNSFAYIPDNGLWFTPIEDNYYSRTFRISDGLPQSTATSIIQSKDGYLWMTTFGGLIRYDGFKFKTFTTGTYPELYNNRLTGIYEDRNGVIWIGSEDGDIIKFSDNKFAVVYEGKSQDNLTPIYKFYLDNSDTLWVGGARGLRTISNSSSQKLPVNDLSVIFEHSVKDIDVDQNGVIYIGTDFGVFKIQGDSSRSVKKLASLGDKWFDFIACDKNNSIWAGTGSELIKLENDIITKNIDLQGKLMWNFGKMSSHNFILAIDFKLFRLINDELQLIPHLSLPNVKLPSLFEDSNQNIWLGSDAGLIKFSKRNLWSFVSIKDSVNTPATAVIQDSHGVVYLATGSKLLSWKEGEFNVELDAATLPNESPSTLLRSLAESPDGGLILATVGQLLLYKDGQITQISNEKEFFGEVGVVVFDSKGNRWIGSKHVGVQVTQENSKTIFNIDNGLAGNSIVRIKETKAGDMYISTRSGLSIIRNGKVENNYTTLDGLGSNHIRDTFEENDGTIWIGTYGGGISRLKDGKIFTLNTKNGLPEDVSSAFLTDDQNNLWVMGNQGVYTLSLTELNKVADGIINLVSPVVYNHNDGMFSAEGNGGNNPSAWKANDGKLWFSMIEGSIALDPKTLQTGSPRIKIEQIRLNGNELPPAESVVIKPDENSLEIDFTGITFNKSEYLTFQYMLDGLDQKWTYSGTRRTAYFQFLPPGEYTFKVMATNGFNSSNNLAELKVIVQASFFQTWYGSVLIFLVLLAIIALFFQIRIKRLEAVRNRQTEFAKQILNAHESERQRIAVDLHDSLGNNLLIIKNWITLAISNIKNQAETRERLDKIYNITSQAIEETRSISRNLSPQHLHRFGLTSTITDLIETVNNFSEIKISHEIDNIDDVFNTESELSLYRLVQEGMNNIIKHSNAANAQVSIKNTDKKILIKIIDDGIGFDKNAILSPIEENSPNISFGLESIKHRAEFLGGTFNLVSMPQKGTKIYIEVNKPL